MSYHKYKILSHKKEIKQLQRREMCIPGFVDLHLNYTCNQNCRGCAYSNWNKGYIAEKEDVFNFIDELIDYGVKAFDIAGGGEPTLLPYLESLIEHILNRNCNYGLITNGLKLNDRLITLAANTATYIRISFEAGYPEAYSYYKQVSPEQFFQVVNNVKSLLKRKCPDTEISLKFSVDKYLTSEKSIFEAVKLTDELGVDMAIWKANAGRSELSIKEKSNLFHFLNTIKKNNMINSILYEKNVPQCWLNPLHTLLDAYGDIYICCYYYERAERHKLGNLKEKTFKEIWESDEHWEKIKNIKKEECTKYDCKFFNHHKIVKKAFKRGRLDIL